MNDSGDYYPYYTNYGENENDSGGSGCGCGSSIFFKVLVVLGIIELIYRLFN